MQELIVKCAFCISGGSGGFFLPGKIQCVTTVCFPVFGQRRSEKCIQVDSGGGKRAKRAKDSLAKKRDRRESATAGNQGIYFQDLPAQHSMILGSFFDVFFVETPAIFVKKTLDVYSCFPIQD